MAAVGPNSLIGARLLQAMGQNPATVQGWQGFTNRSDEEGTPFSFNPPMMSSIGAQRPATAAKPLLPEPTTIAGPASPSSLPSTSTPLPLGAQAAPPALGMQAPPSMGMGGLGGMGQGMPWQALLAMNPSFGMGGLMGGGQGRPGGGMDMSALLQGLLQGGGSGAQGGTMGA